MESEYNSGNIGAKKLKELTEDEKDEIFQSFPTSPVKEKRSKTPPWLSTVKNRISDTTSPRKVTFDIEPKNSKKKIDRERIYKAFNDLSTESVSHSESDSEESDAHHFQVNVPQNESPVKNEPSTDQLRKMLSLRSQHMKVYRDIVSSKTQDSPGKGRGKLIANLKKQHNMNPIELKFDESPSDEQSSADSAAFEDATDEIDFVTEVLPKQQPCSLSTQKPTESAEIHVSNENSKNERNCSDVQLQKPDTADECQSYESRHVQDLNKDTSDERHENEFGRCEDSNENAESERHSPKFAQFQDSDKNPANERESFESISVPDSNNQSVGQSAESAQFQKSEEDLTSECPSTESIPIQDSNQDVTATNEPCAQFPNSNENLTNERESSESISVPDSNNQSVGQSAESAQFQKSEEDLTNECQSTESIPIQDSNQDVTVTNEPCAQFLDSNENLANERESFESISVPDSNNQSVGQSAESAQFQKSEEDLTNECQSTESIPIQDSNQDVTVTNEPCAQFPDSNENLTNERESSESISVPDTNNQSVGQSAESAQFQKSEENLTNECQSTESIPIQDSNQDVTVTNEPYAQFPDSNENLTNERESSESILVSDRGNDSENAQFQNSDKNLANEPKFAESVPFPNKEDSSAEFVQLEDTAIVCKEFGIPNQQPSLQYDQHSVNEKLPAESVQVQDTEQDFIKEQPSTDSTQVQDTDTHEKEHLADSVPIQESFSPSNQDPIANQIPPSLSLPALNRTQTENSPLPSLNVDVTSNVENHPPNTHLVSAETNQDDRLPQEIPPQSPIPLPNQLRSGVQNGDENTLADTHLEDAPVVQSNHLPIPPPNQDPKSDFQNPDHRITQQNAPVKFGWKNRGNRFKAQDRYQRNYNNSPQNHRLPASIPFHGKFGGGDRASKSSPAQPVLSSCVRNGNSFDGRKDDAKYRNNQYQDNTYDKSKQTPPSRDRRTDFANKSKPDDDCYNSKQTALSGDKRNESENKIRQDNEYQNDDYDNSRHIPFSENRRTDFGNKQKYDQPAEKSVFVRREDKYYDIFYTNLERNPPSPRIDIASESKNADTKNSEHRVQKSGKFDPRIPAKAYDNNYYNTDEKPNDSVEKNENNYGPKNTDHAEQKHGRAYKKNFDSRKNFNHKYRADDEKFHKPNRPSYSNDEKSDQKESNRDSNTKSKNRWEKRELDERERNDNKRPSSEHRRRRSQRRDEQDKRERADIKNDAFAEKSNKKTDLEPKTSATKAKYTAVTDLLEAKPTDSDAKTDHVDSNESDRVSESDDEIETSAQHRPKGDFKRRNIDTESTRPRKKRHGPRGGIKERERRRLRELRATRSRNNYTSKYTHRPSPPHVRTVSSIENELHLLSAKQPHPRVEMPPQIQNANRHTPGTGPHSRAETTLSQKNQQPPFSDRPAQNRSKFMPFDGEEKRKPFHTHQNKAMPPKCVPQQTKKIKKKDKKPYCARQDYEPIITEIYGDLFTASEEFSLAHCVGQDFTMGAGIAITFRKMFGRRDNLLRQQKRVGEVAVLPDGKRYIFYLITKTHSIGKPTMDTLKAAIYSLKELCTILGVTKLAIPRLGSGLDRLDWDEVKGVLYEAFRDSDVEIVVYVLP